MTGLPRASVRNRLALVALTILLAACRREEPLPKLFEVPAVQLISDAGSPIDLASLRGQVVIYDFIFTRCAGTCPIMANVMGDVAAKLDQTPDMRFVSISVDPTRDTPEVLRDYAKRVGRKDSRWIFATGERDTIIRLSVEGFKLAAGDPGAAGGEALLHSTKFVLADRSGTIRGYFDALTKDDVEKLVREAKRLAKES